MLHIEASQHIEIALAYIDLGLVDPSTTIFKLLSKCSTKKEVLNVLVPFLSRYRLSEQANLNEFLQELN